jgi:hypothetical protein
MHNLSRETRSQRASDTTGQPRLRRRLGPFFIALASGHRGRPTGMLRDCQAGGLHGHARFGLSEQEARPPGQSASRALLYSHDRLTRS